MMNEQILEKSRDEKAQEILNVAKMYKQISNRNMCYADYEKFKQQLHFESLFGYEKELADILGV